MATTLLQAVHAWFATSTVQSSLPGGLWTGLAPEGTGLDGGGIFVAPYATVNVLAAVPYWNQGGGDYWQAEHITVACYAEGCEEARALGEAWRREFEHATLTMSDRTVSARLLLSRYLFADKLAWVENTLDVWRQSLDYRVFLNRTLG